MTARYILNWLRYSCVRALFLSLSLISCDCKDAEVVEIKPSPTVQLSVEDAGVIDVWLRVKFTDFNVMA